MLTISLFVMASLLYLTPLIVLAEDTASVIYFGGFGVFGFPLCLLITAWTYFDIILPIWMQFR